MASAASDNRVQFRLTSEEMTALKARRQPGEVPSTTAGRLLRDHLGSGPAQAVQVRAVRRGLSAFSVVVMNHVGGVVRAEAERWAATHLLDESEPDPTEFDVELQALREDLATFLALLVTESAAGAIQPREIQAWVHRFILGQGAKHV